MIILEHLQPYISTIVEALIGLLVAFVLGVVAMLRTKVMAWLEARTTVAQRDTLHKLANEAMALIESTFKDSNGPEKLNQAINYVTARVAWTGEDATTIRAAVEKAVLDYNVKVKSGVSGG
jgi:LL-H family phage holin